MHRLKAILWGGLRHACCGQHADTWLHAAARQAWGVLEHRAGNLERARELFQQGVWAQPKGRDVCTVWQVLLAPSHSCMLLLLRAHNPCRIDESLQCARG